MMTPQERARQKVEQLLTMAGISWDELIDAIRPEIEKAAREELRRERILHGA